MRFWDVTIVENGEERETVRGLTGPQTIQLMAVFDRVGIHATAIEYDGHRRPTGGRKST